MTPINPTALSILGFLQPGPLSGREIIATVTDALGPFWSLTTSQIYTELKRLEALKYIKQTDTGAYSTRIYSVTSEGKHIFYNQINNIPGDETIRFPFLLSLRFGEYITTDMRAQILAEHKKRHSTRLAEYAGVFDESDSTTGIYEHAVLSFGYRYEQMVLEWFEEFEHTLLKQPADTLDNQKGV